MGMNSLVFYWLELCFITWETYPKECLCSSECCTNEPGLDWMWHSSEERGSGLQGSFTLASVSGSRARFMGANLTAQPFGEFAFLAASSSCWIFATKGFGCSTARAGCLP